MQPLVRDKKRVARLQRGDVRRRIPQPRPALSRASACAIQHVRWHTTYNASHGTRHEPACARLIAVASSLAGAALLVSGAISDGRRSRETKNVGKLHETDHRLARYPTRHGFPSGMVSQTAWFPIRHGIPRHEPTIVSHKARSEGINRARARRARWVGRAG